MRCDTHEVIEKAIGATWNKRGMSIEIIKDLMVAFVVRVIAHKFYQLSRLNNVPYIVVDLGYKIIKRDYSYDLAELQLQQLTEN